VSALARGPASHARAGIGASGADVSGANASGAEADSVLGMSIFLGAWVMLFAALFLAYGVVRVQSLEWPPFGAPRLPRGVTGLNTLLLLASSLTLRRARTLARRGRVRAFRLALGATLLLGAGFLAAQVGTWLMMRARGLFPSSGVYGSVFFAFSGFHALHVLGGLVVLAVVGIHALWRQSDLAASLRAVRLTALYWDFIAVIWVLMYLSIYWL
jgi:cytochrome c oxidase subunit 3